MASLKRPKCPASHGRSLWGEGRERAALERPSDGWTDVVRLVRLSVSGASSAMSQPSGFRVWGWGFKCPTDPHVFWHPGACCRRPMTSWFGAKTRKPPSAEGTGSVVY